MAPAVAVENLRAEDARARSTRRWLALDAFRGLAVLLMIQGHTFTVLTHEADVTRAWGPWYALLHGLTAPMFLIGAGLAYGFVTLGRSRAGAPDPRLLRRALLLIALGYLLQLPRVSWTELAARRELLAGAASVGPLQLVGLCLFGCELLRASTRTRAARLWASLALLLAISAGAPLVWQARPSARLSLWLASWLDGYASSQFPIFPWAAFFLAGVLLAAPARSALEHVAGPSARRSELRLAAGFALGGLAAAVFAYALFAHGYVLRGVYGPYELWHTSPLYVLFRAGVVVAVLGVLAWLEPVLAWCFARASAPAHTFEALAKQSLVAYVAHLLLLYGSPLTTGLKVFGKLSIATAGLAFAFVLVMTSAIAVLWQHYVSSGALACALRSRPARLRLGALGAREVHRVGERERLDARASQQALEPAAAARDRV